VLVGVLDPDRVQLCITTEVSSCPVCVDVLGTYGQQRRPGPACQHGWLLRCGRSAVLGCGRGRHRSLCRSGGEGVFGLVGRCSSGCLRSCARGQNVYSFPMLDCCLQCQKGHLALLWRHRVSGSGSVRYAPGPKISGGRKMWRRMQPSHPNSQSARGSRVARYIEYIEDFGHGDYRPAAQHLR
jgi:hypothetical protein